MSTRSPTSYGCLTNIKMQEPRTSCAVVANTKDMLTRNVPAVAKVVVKELFRNATKIKTLRMKTTGHNSPSSTWIAWSTSCRLLTIDRRSRLNSHTVSIISSKLTSPLLSRSKQAKHSSASASRPTPSTSLMSSSYSASFPSTTKDIHNRLAKASDDTFFSKASTTIEWGASGLNTCLPVTSCAMLPKAAVSLFPNRPTFWTNRIGVADPDRT